MSDYPNGVWPVMLTPYRTDGGIDYEGLKILTDWYIAKGVQGLFAACQSSEIFYLSPDERTAMVQTVVKAAHGRVPVIASGHVSADTGDTLAEMHRMLDAGADAFILISNRLAGAQDGDGVLLDALGEIIAKSTADLGIYECPYPYKRLLSANVLKACAQSGRFHFLKDTCCDAQRITERLSILTGSPMKLFNANTATLLPSLLSGASGFSGVMASFHPKLYEWLCAHPHHQEAEPVQACLATAAMAEYICYPVCAKYYLRTFAHLPIQITSRAANELQFTAANRETVRLLARLCQTAYTAYCRHAGGSI